MITIEGKAIGRRRPLFADWSIPVPPEPSDDGGGLTLRDLIARVVTVEVEAFRDRQEELRLVRVLSSKQIDQAAERGKIDMGGRDFNQEIEVDQAVAAAWQAFEDGIYLILIDGRELSDLDARVFLRSDSRVSFVRLALMAGG